MKHSVQSAPKRPAGKVGAEPQGREPEARGSLVVAYALFFLAYFVVVAVWAEPRVQYFGRPAAFCFDGRFFRSFLIWPGGIAEFLSCGLHQCHQFTWLGAAVTTVLAGCLTLGSWLLLRRIGPGAAGVLCLWPSLGLLAIQRQYEFPWLEAGIGLTGAVWLAVAYAWMPSRKPWLRLLVFLGLSWSAYALLAGACLFFALYCILVELLVCRRYWLALALGCVAALTPVVGAWYFALHLSDACLLLLPFGLGHMPVAMAALPYLALPMAILVKAGRPFLPPGPVRARRKGGAPHQVNWQRFFEPALSLLLAAAAMGFGWNPMPQRLARMQCFYHDRKWDSVLAEARLLSEYNPVTTAQVNRALYESGRLPYELFTFPQKPDYAFWLSADYGGDGHQSLVPGDALFELGQVNRAERIAGEALELDGYLPDVLKRLADVNVLKGEPGTARIFLNILAKTPFQRDWVSQRLGALDAAPRLPDDPEIQRVRALQITGDFPFEKTTEEILLQCLRQNPNNRAAFEYLMAHYLLTVNLDAFVHYFQGARSLGYSEIPTHCEEALVLAQKLKGAPVPIPDINGKLPRPETTQRLDRFLEQARLYGDNVRRAATEMAPEYGNTYWYYFVFKTSAAALTRTDLSAKQP
jgi:hypothetical protein